METADRDTLDGCHRNRVTLRAPDDGPIVAFFLPIVGRTTGFVHAIRRGCRPSCGGHTIRVMNPDQKPMTNAELKAFAERSKPTEVAEVLNAYWGIAAPFHTQAMSGANDASVLEKELLASYSAALKMPRSQALLLALRDSLPDVAESVLTRSRKLYHASKDSSS
jgi:hypothetical protein